MSKEAAFSTWAWEREIDEPDMRQTFYGGYTSRDAEVATLTREREEAIAKLTSIKPEWEKFVEITEILDIGNTDRGPVTEVRNLIDRADRAEAQLAEAQRALEIDRHALSAMQRDRNQSQREAERLKAALEGIIELAHPTNGLWNDLVLQIDDIARDALNPPAEGQAKPTTE